MKINTRKRILPAILSSVILATIVSQTSINTSYAANKIVKLNTTYKTLKKGQTFKLKLTNNKLNWKISKIINSNKTIATVSNIKTSSAVVKGKNKGITTLTVKLKTSKKKKNNTKTLKCKIKVNVDNQNQTTVPTPINPSVPTQTVIPEQVKNMYTVIFVINDDSPATSQTVEEGSYVPKPANPTKNGYTFAGWYSDLDYRVPYTFTDRVTKDTAIYAKWNKNCLITFNTNGGTMVNNQIVEAGKMVTIPNQPVRNGYVFDGWYIDNNIFANPYNFFNPVSDNITLYAKWLDSAYYNANLGNTGSNNNSNNSNNNNNTSNPTPGTVAVMFDSNGGTSVKTQIINNGQFAQRPESPKRSGYIFSGWFVNTNYDEVYLFESTPVTKDITLYARWIYDGASQGENSGSNSGSNGGTTDKPNNDGNQNNKPNTDQNKPQKNADDVAALTKIIEEQIAKGATISRNIDDSKEYKWNLDSNNEYRLIEINWNDKFLQGQVSFDGLPVLEKLDCSKNNLTNIDVSKNTNLFNFGCYQNQITELHLNENIKLNTIYCYSNQINTIEIDNCSSLSYLSCENNSIKNLTINSNSLNELICSNNKLEQLDVSNCTNLSYIDCKKNELTKLNLENNTNLTNVFCNDNKIQTLNLTHNTKLQTLFCYQNQLNELKLNDNIYLTNLNCSGNLLTNLDLSKNIHLEYMTAHNNKISILDLTYNIHLIYVSADFETKIIGYEEK